MAKPILDDELWKLIEPLLPPPKKRRRQNPGRKPKDRRSVLTGILFVLKTGIPWEYLPKEMGCGSGMTCWRRLRDWQAAGVWEKIRCVLLQRWKTPGKSTGRGPSWTARPCGRFLGAQTGPNPTDRRKPGSKHHVLTDANGIPLATTLTGANTHDVTQLIPLVDAIPKIHGRRGQRRRPQRVQGDRAYDSEPHRKRLRRRGIRPVLAKRNNEHGSGLGVFRWVVERTNSWLHQFRRLRVRFERRPDIHEAFLTLGCILICSRFL